MTAALYLKLLAFTRIVEEAVCPIKCMYAQK